jgi:hypothetical protein
MRSTTTRTAATLAGLGLVALLSVTGCGLHGQHADAGVGAPADGAAAPARTAPASSGADDTAANSTAATAGDAALDAALAQAQAAQSAMDDDVSASAGSPEGDPTQ